MCVSQYKGNLHSREKPLYCVITSDDRIRRGKLVAHWFSHVSAIVCPCIAVLISLACRLVEASSLLGLSLCRKPHRITIAMFLIIHALAVAHYVFGIYYGITSVIFPDGVMPDALRAMGWKKYLTFWNMCLQAVYFTICLINDVTGSNEISPKKTPLVRKIKDYVLCTVGFPVAMFVGLTFWGLYAVDRELVFPKALDPFFPTWLNHVMHTNIMIFTVLEIVLSFRKYPSRKSGLGGLTAFMCVYLAWTFIIYFYAGAWVYPILEVLNWGQRVIFFLVLLLFVNSLYFLGEFINNTIWAKELKQIQSGSGRKKK